MQSITAGGGIIFKYSDNGTEPYILLIRRWGKWDLPKGKKEDGESIEMCAAREVSEELGIPIPSILADIGTTYHEYDREGIHYGKTTHWYAMFTAEDTFIPQTEEDIEKTDWFPLDEAMNIVGYENLKTILKAFKKWYETRKSIVVK